MIKEAYVSFEIAKLLKKAGFDVPIRTLYDEHGDFLIYSSNISNSENFCGLEYYSAPTHQMTILWLLEEKLIWIEGALHATVPTFTYYITVLEPEDNNSIFPYRIKEFIRYSDTVPEKEKYIGTLDSEYNERKYMFASLEDAINSAILHALQNLI